MLGEFQDFYAQYEGFSTFGADMQLHLLAAKQRCLVSVFFQELINSAELLEKIAASLLKGGLYEQASVITLLKA